MYIVCVILLFFQSLSAMEVGNNAEHNANVLSEAIGVPVNLIQAIQEGNKDTAIKLLEKRDKKIIEDYERSQRAEKLIFFEALCNAVENYDEGAVRRLLKDGAPFYMNTDSFRSRSQFKNPVVDIFGRIASSTEEISDQDKKIINHFVNAGLDPEQIFSFLDNPCNTFNPKFVKFCYSLLDSEAFDQISIKKLLHGVSLSILQKHELLDPHKLFSSEKRRAQALFLANPKYFQCLINNGLSWLVKDIHDNTILHKFAELCKNLQVEQIERPFTGDGFERAQLLFRFLQKWAPLFYNSNWHWTCEGVPSLKELCMDYIVKMELPLENIPHELVEEIKQFRVVIPRSLKDLDTENSEVIEERKKRKKNAFKTMLSIKNNEGKKPIDIIEESINFRHKGCTTKVVEFEFQNEPCSNKCNLLKKFAQEFE